MRTFYTFIFSFLFCMTITAQSTIKGKIVDASSGEALIGASVFVKKAALGTITDIDGMFKLNGVADGEHKLEISFIGYETMSMMVTATGGTMDLGSLSMNSGGLGLEEVVVTGVMDIVRDRRTPVAVSTITAREIQTKSVGNVELGEVAKATPSVFVANQAGGYGDSEVWTRGFDQSNTAFLLNGQPINGMEDGKMYWSNWSGLTDVASAVQIQRGLGASKLAISSVGGTWNFVMKATDREEGGSVFSTIGNNAYRKAGVSYSTGLGESGFALTVLASGWSGNGWAYGTRGQGQTYFVSAGYQPNDNHSINFLVTGAPQWHDQKFQTSIYDHEDADGEIDRRYNNNWGIYDGEYFTERRNYYHKPVMNLNWDWTIDEKSKFSTVLYGSFGRGGGTGGLGNGKIRNSSGLIDFDAIADRNMEDPDGVANSGDYEIITDRDGDPTDANYVRRASVNNHNWFGSVLKYERDMNENLNISVGADLRRYYGDHFRQIVDLLGTNGYQQGFHARYDNGYTVTNSFEADPWKAISNYADRESEERVAYNNGEHINYGGVFGQAEYSKDAFSAYLQGSISSQNHVRHEYFYESEENEDSEKVTNTGYNLKLGLSYAVADEHILFANAGRYSRQPFHDVIFEGNSNTLSANLSNEDITGLELGYKYQTRKVSLNFNAYYTKWENRILQNFLDADAGATVFLSDGSEYIAVDDPYENVLQDQIHTGVELELGYNVNSELKVRAFGSVGQWDVDGNRSVSLLDETPRRVIKEYTTSGDDIKVGGAPQTSFGAVVGYDLTNNFSTELQYFYYSGLYARDGGIELPSYGLFDLNLVYTLPVNDGHVVRFVGNIYNLFDKWYISKSRTSIDPDENADNNWEGVNKANQVTFGKGRTWNFTMKYSF